VGGLFSLETISFVVQKQKCFVFLIVAYVFSSTKLEKRAEYILPGSKGEVGGEGSGCRGREKKWPKQCMHV
jgi:hypothetical protein